MRTAFKSRAKAIIKTGYLTIRGDALRAFAPVIQKQPLSALEPIQNILFIRVDRVGDMVLSTPVFATAKKAFPEAHLVVLASPMNAPILKNNPHVDEVILYDCSSSLGGNLHLLRSLRKRHFDLTVDLHDDDDLKTAWLSWMICSTHRIGYAGHGREIFLHQSLPRGDGKSHFVNRALELLKDVGIDPVQTAPAIYLDDQERSWSKQWIADRELREAKLIGIHPGAYYPTQRWPTEYYAELIRLIHECVGAEVILLGGPSDRDVIDEILSRVPFSIVTAIDSNIRRFFSILPHCRILVCNNSGPLHCAAALGVPTISFMGPTVKERWMPVGNMHYLLRRDDLPCIGCNLGYCKIKTHACMQTITPETVLAILKEHFPK
ncbi:MAG TPA: glycosyltransferase family 9 protein [Syntrophobacteraceae bacterium]|nr:glycosyltransferase family 9 protein [Syntrophobacteraceae bacterium]